MHIVIVKNALLPPRHYGGTERVICSLAAALTRAGHRVTLLCAAGSTSEVAEVRAIDPAVDIVRQLPADADIVHWHSAVPAHCELPYVVTIHGNLAAAEPVPPMAIFVSRNHAERHGAQHYVCNGLDWEAYPKPDLGQARLYCHFLGNAAWKVKNVRGAIRIATSLPHEHLHVLGGSRVNFRMGFRCTLHPRVHFHGMVDDAAKQQYISRSHGLVFPILWDEPFGLCLIESLYYGAPVFGTPRGSLPELITPEVGLLSASEEELAQAMRAGGYSPQRCHDYAASLFGADRMAEDYLEMYERALAGERW